MTDNRTTELLPCPFCGGEAHVYKNSLWHVACERAHNGCVTMSAFVTEAEAIAAWNARATGGTLTAEQVREAIYRHSTYNDIYKVCQVSHADMQAIADELNARAERTCECIAEYAESPIDGKTIVLHRCSSCHELMRPYMRFCPSCGAKVVE